MQLIETTCAALEEIRARRPLVHSLTNYVVMNETANAVLCIGALPVMAHAIEEVEEMVAAAGALVLNIGTLSTDWIEAMLAAGRRANALGVPIILDPVGAGATRMRTDAALRLLDSLEVSVLRANAGELAALTGAASEVRGVESVSAPEHVTDIATRFASERGVTAAITGAVDTVTDGSRTARVSNGHVLLSKVVGTGCMSSAIVGAFTAVEQDRWAAAVAGLVALGIAGELAAQESGDRPGTFHVELYDALYRLGASDIRSRARIDVGE